mgnify:FL=1
MSSPKAEYAAKKPCTGLPSTTQAEPAEFTSRTVSSWSPYSQENQLCELALDTKPAHIATALNALYRAAMAASLQGRQAGRLLLSLWAPDQYPLALNDIARLPAHLNRAARHLINFVSATGTTGRHLIAPSEIAPVITAWGNE